MDKIKLLEVGAKFKAKENVPASKVARIYNRDPQAYEVCPYNSAHRILKYRMSTHLVKCRKLYHGESSMTVCLFNANHSVPTTEMEYHLQNCNDRFNLDKQILITSDIDPSRFPVENVEVENEENWDQEECPTYQPDEYCKKNAILRQAKVESAATRKNFRVEERYRIQKLKGAESSNLDGETSNVESKFRSIALANTAANIQEESPYLFEDLQQIIQARILKPVATVNEKPTFVSQVDDIKEEIENCEAHHDADTCNDGATSSSSSLEDKPKDDSAGVIKQKRHVKTKRGRGRGISR